MLKLLILLAVLNFGTTNKIPSFVKLCKRNDPELAKCYVNSMKELLPYIEKGIPQMGLPAIDPLYLERIQFSKEALSKLNLQTELFNISMFHLSSIDIRNFTIDLQKMHFTMDFHYPLIRMMGQYMLKGKLLLFELDSTGDVDFNMTDVYANGEWSGKIITKNKKEHLQLTDSKVDIKNLKTKVHMGQVFKDNEVLTETVNEAVNANVEVLGREFRPLHNEVFTAIFNSFIQAVYDRYSIDELYPPS